MMQVLSAQSLEGVRVSNGQVGLFALSHFAPSVEVCTCSTFSRQKSSARLCQTVCLSACLISSLVSSQVCGVIIMSIMSGLTV
jgi:hypothetical protein